MTSPLGRYPMPISKYLDQFKFQGNRSPTPSLSQHFALNEKKVLMFVQNNVPQEFLGV